MIKLLTIEEIIKQLDSSIINYILNAPSDNLERMENNCYNAFKKEVYNEEKKSKLFCELEFIRHTITERKAMLSYQ